MNAAFFFFCFSVQSGPSEFFLHNSGQFNYMTHLSFPWSFWFSPHRFVSQHRIEFSIRVWDVDQYGKLHLDFHLLPSFLCLNAVVKLWQGLWCCRDVQLKFLSSVHEYKTRSETDTQPRWGFVPLHQWGHIRVKHTEKISPM